VISAQLLPEEVLDGDEDDGVSVMRILFTLPDLSSLHPPLFLMASFRSGFLTLASGMLEDRRVYNPLSPGLPSL